MKYCDKCFVNLKQEHHKPWCPYAQKKMPFEDLLKSFQEKEEES